jgi:anti-anti-sigma regulatory factor
MEKQSLISTFNGQVIILKPESSPNIKESLDQLTAKISELISCGSNENKSRIALILDLSPFNILSSTLLGVIGASLQERHVRTIKLCGMKPAVLETARRLGLIKDQKNANRDSDSNIYKIKVFASLEEGVKSLIPLPVSV